MCDTTNSGVVIGVIIGRRGRVELLTWQGLLLHARVIALMEQLPFDLPFNPVGIQLCLLMVLRFLLVAGMQGSRQGKRHVLAPWRDVSIVSIAGRIRNT